jgi:hypothetical protein
LSDWRLAFASQLGRGTLLVLAMAAGLAVAISALSLWREPRGGRARLLFTLRLLAITACVLVAVQPRLEFGQVSVVPNYVAVLVDS